MVQPISLLMAQFNVEHSAQISKDAIAAAQQTGQGQEVVQESVKRTQMVQAGLAAGRPLAHVCVLGPFAVGVFDPDVVVLLLADRLALAVEAVVETVDDMAHEAVGGGDDPVGAAATTVHVDASRRAVVDVVAADTDVGVVGVGNAVEPFRGFDRGSVRAEQQQRDPGQGDA